MRPKLWSRTFFTGRRAGVGVAVRDEAEIVLVRGKIRVCNEVIELVLTTGRDMDGDDRNPCASVIVTTPTFTKSVRSIPCGCDSGSR